MAAKPVPADTDLENARLLLLVAQGHPEFAGGELLAGDDGWRVRLDIKVEMPLHVKDDGVSETGVNTVETVFFEFPPGYPWRSPRVTLRKDFPRNFPHLLPGSSTNAPRPCLVDGNQDEFFLQFGLVEYGIYQVINQAAVWLRKAAIGDLIDPAQGWEPMMRRDFDDIIAIDAEAARSAVTKAGGFVVWGARYFRRGEFDSHPNSGAQAWISSNGETTPLRNSPNDEQFTASSKKGSESAGNTIVGLVWPDKLPNGKPHVSDIYWPEDIETLGNLRARAKDLGCERGLRLLLSNIERSFTGFQLLAPIPIGIVLCVRRPAHIIGSVSQIELLPYVLEIRALQNRESLFADGDSEPVGAAMHYQTLTPRLLRTLSGAPDRPKLALLGAGSVGSKLAMHAARSGQDIVAVSDEGLLRPHNLARHALGGRHVISNKAEALAEELAALQLTPSTYKGNLVTGLLDPEARKAIIPNSTEIVVNATASLSVREALVTATTPRDRLRLFEAALFARGRIGYILVDGKTHNPSHADLMAELYATLDDVETADLLFDPVEGLTEVQIGQGCGSHTMIVDDAQLSMMTAALSKEICRAVDQPTDEGLIVVGTAEADSPTTRWTRRSVPPFETVAINGSDGWELRIASRVAERIRAESKCYATVETGGIMIGLSSARLKTVTVVDILDAPPDSKRSAHQFVLGTQGLQDEIERRHNRSGRTLFDVGTWHSHLIDVGPSATDWGTAAELAAGRAPPSILLISTPKKFHALVVKRKGA
jgi:Prokaryotic E2 family A/ThiF family/Prokaryotic homologs of the JAB domain